MHSGPSKTAEAIVAVFVPPARREEVLGDLQERYRSRGQYALDAVRTVPVVIFSGILRWLRRGQAGLPEPKSARTRSRSMNSKTVAIICGAMLCGACVLWFVAAGRQSSPTSTYSQFLEKVQRGQIASVVIETGKPDAVQATCRMKDGTSLRAIMPADYRDALAAMLENKVDVAISDPSTGYLRLILQFTPLFLLAGLWTYLLIRQGHNGRFFRSWMGR